jgi:hypothetical protein
MSKIVYEIQRPRIPNNNVSSNILCVRYMYVYIQVDTVF